MCLLPLRGLWLGLADRPVRLLVDSGNVALVLPIALFTPAAFGRMDPPRPAPHLVGRASLSMAGLFATAAWVNNAQATVALMIAMGLLSGYSICNMPTCARPTPTNRRDAPCRLHQGPCFWGGADELLTGAVAAWATSAGLEPYRAVLLWHRRLAGAGVAGLQAAASVRALQQR